MELRSTADARTDRVAELRAPLAPDAEPGRLTVVRSPVAVPADAVLQVGLVHEVLNTLDALLDAPIEERLAVVAADAARCVGAAGWRVSRVVAETVRARRTEIIRPPVVSEGPGARPEGMADDYALASRPAIAAAAEGSALGVTLVIGDPVERRILRGSGFASVVVAGGYDPDAHRWLLELFGDEHTHETHSFAALLLALVHAALGFPRAATPPRATGGADRRGVERAAAATLMGTRQFD